MPLWDFVRKECGAPPSNAEKRPRYRKNTNHDVTYYGRRLPYAKQLVGLTTDIPPRLEYGEALLSSRRRRSEERRRSSSSDPRHARRPRCRGADEESKATPKESRAWETVEVLPTSLLTTLDLLDS